VTFIPTTPRRGGLPADRTRPTLPIDPHADAARRAWLPCPNCEWGRSNRNCGKHWQYLLSNRATLVNLQCPRCATLWSTDTRNP
jgi:hypothetical protein